VVESIFVHGLVVVVHWHLVRQQRVGDGPGKVCLSNAQKDLELETPIQILEKRMIQAQIKYLELMRRNFRAY
jgi:hypothetical protein